MCIRDSKRPTLWIDVSHMHVHIQLRTGSSGCTLACTDGYSYSSSHTPEGWRSMIARLGYVLFSATNGLQAIYFREQHRRGKLQAGAGGLGSFGVHGSPELRPSISKIVALVSVLSCPYVRKRLLGQGLQDFTPMLALYMTLLFLCRPCHGNRLHSTESWHNLALCTGSHSRNSGAVLTSAFVLKQHSKICLLYTSPSPRDRTRSRMPSSA